MTLKNKRILLIISGGIAAYKSLELIRLIKKDGGQVRCILTQGGSQFVTPLSISALSGEKCYTDLWNLTDEAEMGHIRLSREADIVVVAPASADIMAKMAHGMANDLATTTLLATNKPVMVAPAMNPEMWANPATQDNLQTLTNRNIHIIHPADGSMACGETGTGRMVEANDIYTHISNFFNNDKLLSGKSAIVTAGPTFEPIDPVRYIGNRSSGKQGYAIAQSLVDNGADVTLISGPTSLLVPQGMTVIQVETALEMMAAVETALPADIAICAAAVADYGVKMHQQKQKKSGGKLDIQLTDNPDILQAISTHKNRPDYVVGFAAETENVIENAKAKLLKKQCDAIVANQVGATENPVFGADHTSVHWVTKTGEESHNSLLKSDVADMITKKLISHFNDKQKENAA